MVTNALNNKKKYLRTAEISFLPSLILPQIPRTIWFVPNLEISGINDLFIVVSFLYNAAYRLLLNPPTGIVLETRWNMILRTKLLKEIYSRIAQSDVEFYFTTKGQRSAKSLTSLSNSIFYLPQKPQMFSAKEILGECFIGVWNFPGYENC